MIFMTMSNTDILYTWFGLNGEGDYSYYLSSTNVGLLGIAVVSLRYGAVFVKIAENTAKYGCHHANSKRTQMWVEIIAEPFIIIETFIRSNRSIRF